MAAKAAAGSAGSVPSPSPWPRSPSSTAATSSSSRDPKWCNRIRWLVPTSSAIARSGRLPMPPPAKASITASSSARRRASSRGRGKPVLAARLQALGLQRKVAAGQDPPQHTDERAHRSALIDPLPDQRALRAHRDDLVDSEGQPSRTALLPGPRRAVLEIRDRPHEPGQPGLLDGVALADGELRTVQRLDAGDRRRPLRPALDVGVYRPHRGRGCRDLDAAVGNHVPDGTLTLAGGK